MILKKLPSYTSKNHTDHMDAMRHVLSTLMDTHGLNASSWSLQAGKSRNFLTEFMSGRANDMTIGALESLARVIDTTAYDILAQTDKTLKTNIAD